MFWKIALLRCATLCFFGMATVGGMTYSADALVITGGAGGKGLEASYLEDPRQADSGGAGTATIGTSLLTDVDRAAPGVGGTSMDWESGKGGESFTNLNASQGGASGASVGGTGGIGMSGSSPDNGGALLPNIYTIALKDYVGAGGGGGISQYNMAQGGGGGGGGEGLLYTLPTSDRKSVV